MNTNASQATAESDIASVEDQQTAVCSLHLVQSESAESMSAEADDFDFVGIAG